MAEHSGEMRTLVEEIAKVLVDEPAQVSVTVVAEPEETVLELRVAPTDLGKVIGKQGRTAAALRALAASAAERDGKTITLEIREGRP